MISSEHRKLEEQEFHDRLRSTYEKDPESYARYTANKKYYAVTGSSVRYVEELLRREATGRKVLDYGCGGGQYSLLMAGFAEHVTGIDISPDSVAECRAKAEQAGAASRLTFQVGDCEQLPFADGSFDLVMEAGVLHHLALHNAYAEIVRVLRPGGTAIMIEAVAHNPIFALYRRLTPHLRTKWETDHILTRQDLLGSSRYFDSVELRFFHLFNLLAVPMRNHAAFGRLLQGLDAIDRHVLSMPIVKWLAWQVVVIGKKRP
jgi:SAM-dependent methyltransferase